MTIRTSHPRLPRTFWGEIVYATPGSGKTFVANKYRDVVDADDLIVEAINELDQDFDYASYHGQYSDPREVIFQYFRYIKFNRVKMNKIYRITLRKMRKACQFNDVVLLGTRDLMKYADRIFVQRNEYIIRPKFKRNLEAEVVDEVFDHKNVHFIDRYLDDSLHKVCRIEKLIYS